MKLAKAHQRTPGRMNKTELRYSTILDVMRKAGVIVSWGFEAVKLRLADLTFYTPDFMVICSDGSIEFHEVKGSWKAQHQDDSRVKIKVAAEQHQWARFTSYEFSRKRREWFGPHGKADWD